MHEQKFLDCLLLLGLSVRAMRAYLTRAQWESVMSSNTNARDRLNDAIRAWQSHLVVGPRATTDAIEAAFVSIETQLLEIRAALLAQDFPFARETANAVVDKVERLLVSAEFVDLHPMKVGYP